MLPGGPLSMTPYWEAQHAYVQGLYLGCFLLCQTCVEHLLNGLLILSGDEADRSIREGAVAGARSPTAIGRVRSLASDLDPEGLLGRDALEALEGLNTLLKRKPFRWKGE